MQKPVVWTTKQLAVAVYASLYGLEDLGMPLEEILRLSGLSLDQWQTRIGLDFPAQEGRSSFMPRIESWYEEYHRLKKMPRAELQGLCVHFLEHMKARKG